VACCIKKTLCCPVRACLALVKVLGLVWPWLRC